MRHLLEKLSKFHLGWLLIGVGLLILFISSTPVEADLGGSYVAFNPAAGGDNCFVPNKLQYQDFYFTARTTTTDGQDVSNLFIQFPSDWVLQTAVAISSICDNGGSAVFSGSASMGSGGYVLTDTREQNAPETCTIVYKFTVDTGAGETNANMSWAWNSNDTGKAAPRYPCSNDGFNPLGLCDSTVDPPATIPVCTHVTLNILPETLPAAESNAEYREYLTVESGTATSWSASGLPSGMGIDNSTGMMYGWPSETGTFNVQVNVYGTGWSDGSRDYTFTVYPQLTYNPSALPKARLNQPYTQAVTLSGGTESYTLSHTAGTLPAGITFSAGAFGGTPTETGIFEGIVITADYGLGLIKTKTYTMEVLPEHVFSWTPTTPLEGKDATFTALGGSYSYYWTKSPQPGELCSVPATYYYNQVVDIFFGASGDYQVCVSFYDSNGYQVTDAQWVTVINVPPEIFFIQLYPEPSFPGTVVNGEVNFYDADPGPFVCKVNWGDGTPDEEFICKTEENWGDLPQHTYSTLGTYPVQVWVTDTESATSTDTHMHEVVYVSAQGQSEYLLASNTLPTTIELIGYAADGHSPLNFNVSTPAVHGTLGTPTTVDCMLVEAYNLWMCSTTVVYTPESTVDPYVGEDSFSFTVNDGLGNVSAPATINLWVDANQAPVAQSDTATVLTTQPSTILLTATDQDNYSDSYDQLTFFIDTDPLYGTLGTPKNNFCDMVNNEGNWEYTCTAAVLYTPAPGTTATTDSFTFHVNDTHQDSSSATMSLELYTPKTLHVNANDDNPDETGCTESHCNLREAVYDALSGDAIDFTLDLPNTITLIEISITIDKDLVINGPGADQLAISGGADIGEEGFEEHGRVFTIGDFWYGIPANVTMSGLTIKDGRNDDGGGVKIYHGSTLTINDSVIGPNNIVTYAGGGIFNEGGTLTLNRCTVTGNEGTGSLGGAGVTTVGSDAITTIINSTISGNITNNYGGGIYVAHDGLVKLIHTTISGNISNADYDKEGEARGGGAGIYVGENGQVELQNSIVAGNTDLTVPAEAGHDKWPDIYGPVTSLGGNLIGDPTGTSTTWAESDQVGTSASPLDPMLGKLNINSPGMTPTMALLAGSPAIDAAPSCEVMVDQRGISRPQGSACDIGAYELEQEIPTGALKISKVFDPSTSGFIGTFTIHYDCDDGTAHDGTVVLEGNQSQIITGIPIDTNCAVTEPTLPLPPSGWTFGTPSFSPSNTLLINETLVTVTVTNSIIQDDEIPNPQFTTIYLPIIQFSGGTASDLSRLQNPVETLEEKLGSQSE